MFDEFLEEKNDQINNAAYRLLNLLAGVDENDLDELIENDEAPVEWDLEMIGEVVDEAKEQLRQNGIETCHPFYEAGKDEETPCYCGKDCTNPKCLLRSKDAIGVVQQ